LASLLVLATACSNPISQPERSPTAGPTRRGTIAFGGVRGSGTSHIWLVNADGSRLRQLTTGRGTEFRPAWSPDGTELAFVSAPPLRGDESSVYEEDWNICLIHADGSAEVCVTQNELTNKTPVLEEEDTPSWSPDGSTIVYACHVQHEADICLIGREGSGMTQLTKGPAADLFPTWSLDGSKIFFIRIRSGANNGFGDIVAMNPDGTGLTFVTKGQHVGNYALSPDGSQLIVYTDVRTFRLYEAYAGTSSMLLDPGFGSDFVQPAWSPDGSTIALASDGPEPELRLYLMRADGTGLIRVPNVGFAGNPVWRPQP
jgi:Tol biopolymer transport system component